MKLFNHFSIRAKISIGFGIMAVVLIIVGLVGVIGIQKLSKNLSYITGPAWDTADGAMEAAIGIEAQVIAITAIVSGKDQDRNFSRYQEADAMSTEALERLAAAGLMDKEDVNQLINASNLYREQVKQVLTDFRIYQDQRLNFDTTVAKFVQLGEEMEEIGDGAIEEVASDPTASYRWQGDLDKRWAAADGGMESNIGLLWGLYHLGRLLDAEGDTQEIKQAITKALSFQKEASSEMLNTGRFNKPAGSQWGNKSYAETYRDYFQTYQDQLLQLISAYESFHQSSTEYELITNNLLNLLESSEEAGDAMVEGQIQAITQVQYMTEAIMVGITILGTVLAVIFSFGLVYLVTKPINDVIAKLKDIAEGEGDLTRRMNVSSRDEMGQLAKAFNSFIDKLNIIIKEVTESSKEMHCSVQQMQLSTNSAVDHVNQQNQKTDQIATAFTQLSSTAKEISQNTASASQSASDANQKGLDASTLVAEAITTIHELAGEVEEAAVVITSLEQDVTEIVSVLAVIQGIAEQTNLLALNAAIEAARAGEQGRGFAVVADEVRALAGKTQESTEEIRAMIERLQQGSSNAVAVMGRSKERGHKTVDFSERVSESLNEITALISQINNMNIQMASASEEQTAVSDEMNHNVQFVAKIAEEVSTKITETNQCCMQLVNRTNHLDSLVSRFKV